MQPVCADRQLVFEMQSQGQLPKADTQLVCDDKQLVSETHAWAAQFLKGNNSLTPSLQDCNGAHTRIPDTPQTLQMVGTHSYLPSFCRCAVACLTILVEMRVLGTGVAAPCSSSDSSARSTDHMIRLRLGIPPVHYLPPTLVCISPSHNSQLCLWTEQVRSVQCTLLAVFAVEYAEFLPGMQMSFAKHM